MSCNIDLENLLIAYVNNIRVARNDELHKLSCLPYHRVEARKWSKIVFFRVYPKKNLQAWKMDHTKLFYFILSHMIHHSLLSQ